MADGRRKSEGKGEGEEVVGLEEEVKACVS